MSKRKTASSNTNKSAVSVVEAGTQVEVELRPVMLVVW